MLVKRKDTIQLTSSLRKIKEEKKAKTKEVFLKGKAQYS